MKNTLSRSHTSASWVSVKMSGPLCLKPGTWASSLMDYIITPAQICSAHRKIADHGILALTHGYLYPLALPDTRAVLHTSSARGQWDGKPEQDR